MQLWTQFYAAIGAASAALLGLLFVAVSINVSSALVLSSSGIVDDAVDHFFYLIIKMELFNEYDVDKCGRILTKI